MSDEPPVLGPEDLNGAGGAWQDHLGLEFDEVTPTRLIAHLDVGPRHHQPYGIAHGGVWCSVVEGMASIAAGVNLAATGQAVVGVSNQTDFLRPVRDGRVFAVAEPIHLGRLQHLWQVTITRETDSKVVARGQVRLQVIDADRDLAGRAALDGVTPWGRRNEENP